MLICFVGIDGSGKTTHALSLLKQLQIKGVKCLYLRPHHIFGQLIPQPLRRRIEKFTVNRNTLSINSGSTSRLDRNYIANFLRAMTFLLLWWEALVTYFVEARPLTKHFVLIYDRYFYDYFNGANKNLGLALVRAIPKPHLVFFLYLDVGMAVSRMQDANDRSIPYSYHESSQQWYAYLAKHLGFITINVGAPLDKAMNLISLHMSQNLDE